MSTSTRIRKSTKVLKHCISALETGKLLKLYRFNSHIFTFTQDSNFQSQILSYFLTDFVSLTYKWNRNILVIKVWSEALQFLSHFFRWNLSLMCNSNFMILLVFLSNMSHCRPFFNNALSVAIEYLTSYMTLKLPLIFFRNEFSQLGCVHELYCTYVTYFLLIDLALPLWESPPP